jgi:ABC-type lipoprotein release transport system permease subunit
MGKIALRNLFSSFLNVIIGAIILVGTLLLVVGWSILSSIDSAMSKSIIGSIAGHIQVYSNESKEELTLYDHWTLPDITPIADFSRIKSALTKVPNVKTVVPMGINGANVMHGNTVDLTLEKLRNAVKEKIKGNATSALQEKIDSLKLHVRQIIRVISEDYQKFTVVAEEKAIEPAALEDLDRASSDDFWNSFDQDPLAHLEFMENKIALLVPDADYIYLSYVGTDLAAFKNSFDRMKIVDGQNVPTGQRGLILSKYMYEDQFKLKTARRLDKIREALKDEGKKIATDPDLMHMIKQNRTQTREFLLQLDPLSARKAQASLQSFLKVIDTDLGTLFSVFFDMNDETFFNRYEYFYKELAPLVELYRLRPGDFLTIKAYTKSGFVQSSNVKVYGTFQFKGLEKSGLAGGVSLMDLMTFRDLYGYVTPEKMEETQKLKGSSGVEFVDRSQAEAQLFAGNSVVESATEKNIDESKELGGIKYDDTARDLLNRSYSPEEIEKGVVLNAAIILENPKQIKATMADIAKISLDQGLNLRVVTWQKAAGTIGQFVFMAKAVLYFAVFIIFVVAIVIMNNAVMMATLQRTAEIGTMRAIGAQRQFVLGLVMTETLLLGLVFGSIGTLLGSLLVEWIGYTGIPAFNEFLYFFFSGPRLYVSLNPIAVGGAFLVICAVTTISALYPAILATQISPLQAMQTEE